MQLGIVGLPNVGKSTLFNAITQAGAESANYPFCTIEPNVGMVTVPDYRIDTQVMKAIVEEQDSGVVDDRESYDADNPVHAGGTEDRPYDPEDDPDAAVWAAG